MDQTNKKLRNRIFNIRKFDYDSKNNLGQLATIRKKLNPQITSCRKKVKL